MMWSSICCPVPTGSGKTLVGIKAIAQLNTPTLVVAPTLDLVAQWRTRLKKEFKIEVGVLGGGEWEIKALTVSTYDSAYIHADKLGNRFGLIIFDEVHHLPATGYRNIAEMFASPFRTGLTAPLSARMVCTPSLTGSWAARSSRRG